MGKCNVLTKDSYLDMVHFMQNKAVIFLHGFLGTSEDWIPVMRPLSATTRCISIDLPGHGESNLQSKQGFMISLDLVTEILHKLICDVTTGGVVLVGYSMGARIALHMALKYKEKVFWFLPRLFCLYISCNN